MRGVDMFDCVLPTRAGRHGLRLYALRQDQSRRAATMRPRPLDPDLDFPAARDYSRAYLHHLIRAGESLGGMLLTWNNVAYYQSLLMAGLAKQSHAARDFPEQRKEG